MVAAHVDAVAKHDRPRGGLDAYARESALGTHRLFTGPSPSPSSTSMGSSSGGRVAAK